MIQHRHPRPRPRPGRPAPGVLAATAARYREQLTSRRGPIFDYLAAHVPAVYDDQGAPGARRRSLRSDGSDSLLCLIVTLLECSDIRTGFIGRPPVMRPGRWHRRTVAELGRFAYGGPIRGVISQRRTERHLRALVAIGALRSRQVNRPGASRPEGEAAVRHLTEHLFRIAGTLERLRLERRRAFEEQSRPAARPASPPAIAPALPQGISASSPPAGARAGPPRELRELVEGLKTRLRRS